MSEIEYRPQPPHGRPVSDDAYFTLMADDEGVGFVHAGDGVAVVPLTEDGQVLLALERSPAFDRELLVLAGGEVEEGEALEDTANRELQEELGWRAGRMDFLGELYAFKYLTTRQFVFLARDLTPSKLEGDERHPVRTRAAPLDGFMDLVKSGELHDATAVGALGLARDFMKQEGAMSQVNKFEEYKVFVEDTARFTERRQTVNNTYVAVNSIVLTAAAFLAKDAGFAPLWRAYVVMLVLAAGLVICLQWERLIGKYKQLVGFRIKQLRAMEELPEMAGSWRMYHAEDELYPCDEQGDPIPGQGLNISDRERWLPRVFMAVYALFLLGFIVVLLIVPQALG